MRFITLLTTLTLCAASAIAAPQPAEDLTHLLVRGGSKPPSCPQKWDDYDQCCKDRDNEWNDYDKCDKEKSLKKKKYDDCCKANPLLGLVLCKAEKIIWELLGPKCDACWNVYKGKKDDCDKKKKDCDKYCPRH